METRPNALAVMAGLTPTLSATMTRAGQATAYTAGDIIANSQTGSSVTPIEFTVEAKTGRIYGARAVLTPASSNLVITNCAFDLLLFRPVTDIPIAAGSYPADNAALAVTAAAFRHLIGVLSFTAGAWRNPAGVLTAGVTGYQAAVPFTRPFFSFNLEGLSQLKLLGVLQAQAAWDPGNIAQQFDFTLDADLD